MRLITIATDLDNPLFKRLLVPSCAAQGIELTVLRPGRKSILFAEKRAIIGEYLDRSVPPEQLVMFTDAYDVAIVRGAAYIEDRYARFAQRIVFAAEPNSWPMGVVGLALHDGPPVDGYPYLNSGGFIGPAGDIVELCGKYPEVPSDRFPLLDVLRAHGYDTDGLYAFSDQYYWTLVRHLEPDWIGLDHHADIFRYYGPSIPDVVLREVMLKEQDFRDHGRASALYASERVRVQALLEQPCDAAQLHFAGAVTKAVVRDLLTERLLPDWLLDACRSEASIEDVVRVVDV